jgi:hypothetical protein
MLRSLYLSLFGTIFLVGFIGFSPSLQAAEKEKRVAILPLSAMAVSESIRGKIQQKLISALKSQFDVEIVSDKDVKAVVRRLCGKPSAWWECLSREEHLFSIGNSLNARIVVAGRLAAIGEKRVLKVRMVDVQAGRVSAEVVSIPAGNEEEVLVNFLMLHDRLFPKGQPKAWYEKWEVWAIAGAGIALVAGAVAIGLVVSSGNPGSDWDIHRTLP